MKRMTSQNPLIAVSLRHDVQWTSSERVPGTSVANPTMPSTVADAAVHWVGYKEPSAMNRAAPAPLSSDKHPRRSVGAGKVVCRQ